MTFKVKSGLTVGDVVVINANGHVTTSAENANNLGGQSPDFYTNATNLSTGTVDVARLPAGTTSTAGILRLVDDIANTSITIAPTANAVKTAYDLAAQAALGVATAYSNAATYADTKAAAAYSNATSYADTKAAAAFSNAVSFASSAAANAYSNAVTYTITLANTAYTNAIAFAANASNLSTGTVPNARLNAANTTQSGIVQLVDSIANVSSTHAATANSVKRAYDAAVSAYTNAVAFAIPKSGIESANAQLTFSNTITFSGGISANGTTGSNGAYLTSNGTAVFWFDSPNPTIDSVLGYGNTTTKTLNVGDLNVTGNVTFNGGDAMNIHDIDAPIFNGVNTVFRLTVNNGEAITPQLVAPEQMMIFLNNRPQKVHKRKVYYNGLVFSTGIPVVLETGDVKVNANGTIQFSRAPKFTDDFVGRVLNSTQTTSAAVLPAPTTYPFHPLAIALDNF